MFSCQSSIDGNFVVVVVHENLHLYQSCIWKWTSVIGLNLGDLIYKIKYRRPECVWEREWLYFYMAHLLIFSKIVLTKEKYK